MQSLINHLRNGADTEISAVLDYLTHCLLSVSTPFTKLSSESTVEFIHTFPFRCEVIIEEIQWVCPIHTSRNLTEILRVIGALALGLSR